MPSIRSVLTSTHPTSMPFHHAPATTLLTVTNGFHVAKCLLQGFQSSEHSWSCPPPWNTLRSWLWSHHPLLFFFSLIGHFSVSSTGISCVMWPLMLESFRFWSSTLVSMYTPPLRNHIYACGSEYHLYAADFQIFTSHHGPSLELPIFIVNFL